MLFIFKLILLQIFTLIIFTTGDQNHKKPGCGKPDTITLRYVPMMESNSVVVWPKREISYVIRNVSAQLMHSDVQRVFKEAAGKWTNVTNHVYLYEKNDMDADIHVFFISFNNSNMLGCAEYPPGGMIYFNQDLKWAISKNQSGYNFEWVVAHELGHALGLGHRKKKDYIMHEEYVQHNVNPTMKEVNELREMTNDLDKNLDTSALCDYSLKIDALHYKDFDTHIFLIKNQYWEFNRSLKLLKGPIVYSANSTALYFLKEEGVDGAIRSFSGRDILFKNNTAYKYNFNTFDYDEENLSSVLGNVSSPIDDVISIDSNSYYIFKGEFVYKTDLICKMTTRKSISDEWPGVPNNINGATVMDDLVIFVKSNQYFIFDISTRKVNKTGKLKDFFNCPDVD